MMTTLLFSCQFGNKKAKSGGILKAEQANIDIQFYHIELDVNPDQKSISGYTRIDFNSKVESYKLIFDLDNELTISDLKLDNKTITFTHKNDLIVINDSISFKTGKHSLEVKYHGKPHEAVNPPWDGGFTWSEDSNGNPWIAVTCQLNGAKLFYPCKDHPSDEPDLGAELIVTVPKGLVVAGPGLLINKSTKDEKDTFHWKTEYPINNYNIVFNVGKFSVVSKEYTTIEGNNVPMEFYVLEESVDKAEYHLTLLERSTSILEKYFGEYPWVKEKIAICETPHLGMEHQTMNAYGNKFKYGKIGKYDNDWLMHHELGHEWWGNKVSVSDFADLWIQEGICNYADALNVLELGGDTAYHKEMQKRAKKIKNETAVVLGKNLASDTVYHADIYGKGGFFIHTLRFILGDSIFFPTLKELSTREAFTYQNLVTTKDMEILFSEAYGKDLSSLFDFYLRTTKKLEVKINKLEENSYQISFTNYFGELPVEIKTDEKIQRIIITENGVTVNSMNVPEVDPNGFYLKTIIN
jgi:aminopeptidase N